MVLLNQKIGYRRRDDAAKYQGICSWGEGKFLKPSSGEAPEVWFGGGPPLIVGHFDLLCLLTSLIC